MAPPRFPFLPRRALLLAAALVACAPAALWAQTRPAAQPRPVTPRGELLADERSTIALFERAKESVVYITTQAQVRDFWSRNVYSVPRGSGSGFIWDEGGLVVTNYHVVEGASEATVKLASGADFRATLVGASPAHDIAVLKIATGAKHPPPLPLGSSHDLKVGQRAYAIGNPFGLDWSLTSGLISALNRSLTGDNGNTVEHLIQTDAAINPGNSGGPLLDSAGRLIGINTAIYSPSGASAGIGFAVPVDTVNRVVPELIRHGKYTRPSLGLEIDEDLNRRLTRAMGLAGVVVLRVPPKSAGAAAGLTGVTVARNGSVTVADVITAVEGQPVDTVGKLMARLDDYRVGDSVRLTVRNGEATRQVSVALQAGQ
jgi:S1-C subfamily serine protease